MERKFTNTQKFVFSKNVEWQKLSHADIAENFENVPSTSTFLYKIIIRVSGGQSFSISVLKIFAISNVFNLMTFEIRIFITSK
jgi:hypothetical protein